jgi:V/A-type H+-transporting ATPase subunit E
MAEELQSLLDRIQKEGIEKAQADSDRMLAAAKTKADQMVREAEQKAKALIEQARKDAEVFTDRSIQSIGHASRDLVLAVGDAVQSTLQQIMGAQVATALTTETLSRMLVAVVTAYTKAPPNRSRIEFLLDPEQQQDLLALMHASFAEALREGITIKGDTSVVSGFRAVLPDQNVEHDFTGEAVTEALGQILRPHLAEILRQSLKRIEATNRTP